MTGVLNAMVGSGVTKPYIITIGTGGVGNYGYLASSYGAISSSAVAGRNISGIGSTEEVLYDFIFSIDGSAVGQHYIREIRVQDSTGAIRVFSTASAAVFSSNTWQWGNGSSRVWTSLTPSPRSAWIMW
jgi:hypothetical protein